MTSVDNLGEMGETVSVKRGYARNFLIPKGVAVEATEGNAKMVLEHMKLESKRAGLDLNDGVELTMQEDPRKAGFL